MTLLRREDDTTLADCAVVVVTYNSADHLEALLTSVESSATELAIRIVVVDNGSTDRTVEIAGRSPHVRCVQSATNLGYAGGINAGRSNAGQYRNLLVLNPDLLVRPDTLERLCDAVERSGVGAAVPRLVDDADALRRSLRREPTVRRALGDALFGDKWKQRPAWCSESVDAPGDYVRPHPICWATGAVIMVSRDCDLAVGEWDEAYFMYSEEVDYALRIRDAGYRVEYEPNAVAVHAEGGSGRSGSLVALMALNRVRLFRSRHGRLHTAAFRLVVALHELSRFWDGERRRSALVALGLTAPPRFDGAEPIAAVPW